MTIGFYKTQEELNSWAESRVNAYRRELESFEQRRRFEPGTMDAEWAAGNVRYLKRQIRKHEKMIVR